jgi:hypothetical protein
MERTEIWLLQGDRSRYSRYNPNYWHCGHDDRAFSSLEEAAEYAAEFPWYRSADLIAVTKVTDDATGVMRVRAQRVRLETVNNLTPIHKLVNV